MQMSIEQKIFGRKDRSPSKIRVMNHNFSSQGLESTHADRIIQANKLRDTHEHTTSRAITLIHQARVAQGSTI